MGNGSQSREHRHVAEPREIFAGGKFVPAHSVERLDLIDPVSELVVGRIPDCDATDVDTAVRAARSALPAWKSLSASIRASYLRDLADTFEARGSEMAGLVASLNGSPRWFTNIVNHARPVTIYRQSSDGADALQTEEVLEVPDGQALRCKEPIGVVGIIVPWNAPQALLAARLGPALAAGCTVVAKPSPEVSLGDLLFAEIVREAGLPPGVVNIVTGGRETGARLVRHPGVDKVAFVGSTAAGRDIAAACGHALKPVSAELGGKSAAIILDDADLGTVTSSVIPQCLPYSGQVCYSLTRVLAPHDRFSEVADAIVETLQRATIGDPADPETVFGPLISASQQNRVSGYIQSGIDDGARPILGVSQSKRKFPTGYFVNPTVFVDVEPSMSIFQDEIFGPVLVIVPSIAMKTKLSAWQTMPNMDCREQCLVATHSEQRISHDDLIRDVSFSMAEVKRGP